jgi:hypothetical protein
MNRAAIASLRQTEAWAKPYACGGAGLERIGNDRSASLAKVTAVTDTLIVSIKGYLLERKTVNSYHGTSDVALTLLAAPILRNVFVFNILPPDSVGAAIAQFACPATDTIRDSLTWLASDKAFAGRVSFPPVNNGMLRILIYSKSNRLSATITAPIVDDTTGISVTLPFAAFTTGARDTFVRTDMPLVLKPAFGNLRYSGKFYWNIGNDKPQDSTQTASWVFNQHISGRYAVTASIMLENGIYAGPSCNVTCWLPNKVLGTGLNPGLVVKIGGSLWSCGWDQWINISETMPPRDALHSQIMTNVNNVSTGYKHIMILKTDGSLWACGSNDRGQLGDATLSDRATPVRIMSDVKSIAAGYYHSLIVKTDGSLWACGENESGQLGDGTDIDRSNPQLIMDDVQSVSAGRSHTMILKTDGSVWACGWHIWGGIWGGHPNADILTPVQIVF